MLRDLLDGEYFPFGVQYYRAPSPVREDWDRDLANIAALGFNTVKFWVQWRWNNPREGEYYFEDIDILMELAARHRLRVMLNTIVDVAPSWIYRKYPDASMISLDGRRIGPQVQPHRQIGGLGLCLNHAPAMEHLFRFLHVTFRRYKDHSALAIWNVASEPELTSSMAELRLYAGDAAGIGDMLCYCERCRSAFRTWLQTRYPDIAALNAAWNRNYSAFEEIELPLNRNGFNDVVDWRMFFVHVLGENVKRRFEAAREEDGGAHPLMCHHVFIQGFPVTSTANDPWNVGQYGDLHGITQMDDPMMCDVLRSCAKGKPVISAEMLMLFGYTLDMPKPIAMNDIKRYVFTGIASNLKGFVFWQYRPEVLAREAPAWGLTTLDGSSTPWLEDFAAVNGVIQKNAGFLLDAEPRKAEVALLYNPENQIFGWAATGNEMNVTDSLLGVHKALYASNLVIDLIHPREIAQGVLSAYTVCVVPFPYFLDKDICAHLASWVHEGGVLIGECYFAGWNKELGQHQTTIPGYGLERVFQAHQGHVVPPDETGRIEIITTVDLPHLGKGTRIFGSIVKECLIPQGAEVVATFASGEPAITVGTHGKGQAILIGSYVGILHYRENIQSNGDLLSSLVDLKAGLSRPVALGGARIRVDTLTARDGARMLILRNLGSDAVNVRISFPGYAPGSFVEQFNGEEVSVVAGAGFPEGSVSLGPAEVKVYRD
jgi:beta-galactosidase